MINDPDEYCPQSPYRDAHHALWPMFRHQSLWWLPKRWRTVWRCIYCKERAR